MDSKPRSALILHASAGHGHQKAAEALAEALNSKFPHVQTEVLDALDFFPLWLKKVYAGSYLFLIHRLPFLWGWCYGLCDQGALARLVRGIRHAFNCFFAGRLIREILGRQPDVIFCTHFLPAEIVASLKSEGRLRSKCVTTVTDFLVHRFWVFRSMDEYAVAMPKTKAVLAEQGIEEERIRITGIPVGRKFVGVSDQRQRRIQFGLAPEAFIVLLTSGGSGAGPIGRVIRVLCERERGLQFLVVCGHNKRLWKRMMRLASGFPQVRVFGFVHNMDELMDCADVVIGKAGGLTLSEALAKRKIFLILSPVPGQETGNTSCLVEAGAAMWIKRAADLPDRIHELATDPKVRDGYTRAIDSVRMPDSSERIVGAWF